MRHIVAVWVCCATGCGLWNTPPPVAKPPQPAAPGPARKAVRLAVFDVVDPADRLDGQLMVQLTDQLQSGLGRAGVFHVVERSELAARVAEQARTGDRQLPCMTRECLLSLGRALSARKSLSTQIRLEQDRCAIEATLHDLEQGTIERTATVRTECSEPGLLSAVLGVVKKLAQ